MLSTVGKSSVDDKYNYDIFLTFPRKQALILQAKCEDNLHEMSKPVF